MRRVAIAGFAIALASCVARAAMVAVAVPPPVIDDALASESGRQTAVVAGGCFWGVQWVYQHVRGVTRATSGYAGGANSTARYDNVETGRTGHAESVEIEYDPSQITYGQLLRVFFAVAHDPTQLNRQGPDVGTQYRSAIFTRTDSQARIARAYVDQLNQGKVFPRSIVTEVGKLPGFYPAEPFHQDYATRHPDDPYIRINDAPRIELLQKILPEYYKKKQNMKH